MKIAAELSGGSPQFISCNLDLVHNVLQLLKYSIVISQQITVKYFY